MSNFGLLVVSGGQGGPSLATGTYDGLIHAIVHYGTHPKTYNGQEQAPKDILKVFFEVPQEGEESAVIGYREMTAVVHEKSNLVKFFRALGVIKTDEDLLEIFKSNKSVTGLLGTPAQLEVEVVALKDGKEVSAIQSVTKLHPKVVPPTSVLEPYVFSFGDPSFEVFSQQLTKYTRKRIMSALNAKDLPRQFHEFYMAEVEQAAENAKDAGGVI